MATITPGYFLPIASLNDVSVRNIRSEFIDSGATALDAAIQVAYDLGYRRIIVHNWFGTVGGEMQWDQYLDAVDQNTNGTFGTTPGDLNKILDLAAIRTVVQKWINLDVEVIFYIGTQRNAGALSLERSWDSLYPFFYWGVKSLAFDASSNYVSGEVAHQVLEDLTLAGITVYQEALQLISNTDMRYVPISSPNVYEGVRDGNNTLSQLNPDGENIIFLRSDRIDGGIYDGTTESDPTTLAALIAYAQTLVGLGITPFVYNSTLISVSDFYTDSTTQTIYSEPDIPLKVRDVTILKGFTTCDAAKNWNPLVEFNTNLQAPNISVVTSLGEFEINAVDYEYAGSTIVSNTSITHTWSREPIDPSAIRVTMKYTQASDDWEILLYTELTSVAYADSTNNTINPVVGKVKDVWGTSLYIPSTGQVLNSKTGVATITFS